MSAENNLAKLAEYLENPLAKRLLEAYQKDSDPSSIQSVLDSELAAKAAEETNDHPEKD